jgi:hypothetical protein
MNTTVQTKPKATLPDPDINEVSKPYWDALKKGKLTFQHCRKCGNNWLPARGELGGIPSRVSSGVRRPPAV